MANIFAPDPEIPPDPRIDEPLSGSSRPPVMGFDMFGLLGTGLQLIQTLVNWDSQNKNLDFQKKQWEETKAREDTAMQRRMADLRAAGVNPLMALGTPGASAQTAPNTQSPQVGGMENILPLLLTMMRMKTDIHKTEAETALLESQKNRVDTETAFMQESNPLTIETQKNNNRFLTETLQARINAVKLDNDIKSLTAQNQKLDAQLKDYGISAAKLDNVRRVWENRLKEQNLTQIQQDIVLKDLTLKLTKLALTQQKFKTDTQLFEFVLDSMEQAVNIGTKVIGR